MLTDQNLNGTYPYIIISFSTGAKMTKLTALNVLFNFSTNIYSQVDNYISFERLQNGLFRKNISQSESP